jgi:adenosylmethionine-8-amino-7-oxononanoate aminotransferase
MILAIEMVKDKQQHQRYAWQERRGAKVYRHAVEKGAFIRPLGDVVYFIPPYVITPEEIRWLAKIAEEGIDFATKD